MEDFNDKDAQILKKEVQDIWFNKFGDSNLEEMDDDEILDQAIQMARFCDKLLIENMKNERSEAEIFKNELYLTMKLAVLKDVQQLPDNFQEQFINAYHKAIGLDGMISFIKSCKLNNII